MGARDLAFLAASVALGALVTSYLSRNLRSVPDLDFRQAATLLGAASALNLGIRAVLE